MCLSFRNPFCQLNPLRAIAKLMIILVLGKMILDPQIATAALPLRWLASEPIPAASPHTITATIADPPTAEQFGSPTRCGDQPSGLGFPGFPLGSSRSAVESMLGVPNDSFRGYWGDTTALVYHLIPGEVSLGLLFDRQSQQLQQTEASFAVSIGIDVVFETLDTMLGCRLNDGIREGVRQVWSAERRSYRFSNEILLGLVQWESTDRLYIGVWLANFHGY
ncbi:MAG: hypothetical protein HC795_13620 [Coleofasciculaceae cyanobacterium RL_1_1]|nr:hypothetical protein [Coleofasciculaceae cyanobacterium RL_1_1]